MNINLYLRITALIQAGTSMYFYFTKKIDSAIYFIILCVVVILVELIYNQDKKR